MEWEFSKSVDILFCTVAWTIVDSLALGQASGHHRVIFHGHRHETCRCRIRNQVPEMNERNFCLNLVLFLELGRFFFFWLP